ncbi:MAG TPA: YkgJ family cysteine cluster protein [Nitrospirota bacterium]|nr:YkgJ family cysteine cluster protein [Nitrospirota bacterium]
MQRIVKKYAKFLERSSDKFREATSKHGVGCKRGCNECCSVGFFDITLLDAIHLRAALKNIPADIRNRVISKANEQLDILENKKAFSRKDPLLKSLSAIDSISRRSAKMQCPALDDNGGCLIYNQRPHICRIFGPTIRGPRRAIRLEGCGYFTKDIPEADFPIFEHYDEEKEMQKAMFQKAGRKRIREVDTIIPAALTLDLKKWL